MAIRAGRPAKPGQPPERSATGPQPTVAVGPRQQPAPPSLRTRALRLLARREHSRQELERKLGGDAVDPQSLASLLDDFERSGWLSEARVAEQQVAKARGRFGPRHVLNNLKEKGLSGDVLAQAAVQLKQSELENAREVWRKRFGQPPKDLKDRARQARFLAGRGFGAGVIRQVLGGDPDEF